MLYQIIRRRIKAKRISVQQWAAAAVSEIFTPFRTEILVQIPPAASGENHNDPDPKVVSLCLGRPVEPTIENVLNLVM